MCLTYLRAEGIWNERMRTGLDNFNILWSGENECIIRLKLGDAYLSTNYINHSNGIMYKCGVSSAFL